MRAQVGARARAELMMTVTEPLSAPAEAPTLDAILLDCAPLTARDVIYVGEGFDAFAGPYRWRNPKANLATLDAGGSDDLPENAFDLVVLGPGAGLAPILRRPIVREGGVVVLSGCAGEAPPAELASAGYALVGVRNAAVGPVWVARRGGPIAPRLHVELFAYAHLLMDIRTRLPMAQLDTEAGVTARFRKPPFSLPRLGDGIAKIVIVQRPRDDSLKNVLGFVGQRLATGWVPVLEVDDHPELMLRVRGETPTDATWNVVRAMGAVQTSTPALAEVFRAYNPEVKVFPNTAFELRRFAEGDRPRRVFYGAISRGGYAVEVARSLGSVVKQFPDTEFVVVGDRAVFNALPTRRKRYEDFLPYEQYLALMRTCSVALSPLAEGPSEAAKSDAKFLDAAQSGALLIASPLVYGDVIRHGENGLIARSREQWAPLLSSALRNQAKRREMARRAWQEVRDGRMYADQIQERSDWYLDLWNRRAAIEARLCEQYPGLAQVIEGFRTSGG